MSTSSLPRRPPTAEPPKRLRAVEEVDEEPYVSVQETEEIVNDSISPYLDHALKKTVDRPYIAVGKFSLINLSSI
jgi:hypothetical protein